MSLACPKISTFINQSQCCIVPCIYLPDYSSETLAVLIELLTTGKTVTIQKSKIDFEELKDLAAELGLNGNGFLQAKDDNKEGGSKETKITEEQRDISNIPDTDYEDINDYLLEQLLKETPVPDREEMDIALEIENDLTSKSVSPLY